ncbi:MAG: RNA pseudouridine synthase [bacterium]
MEVLFEDNHTIVVVKPPGLPVQGDDSGDESLLDQVKSHLKESCGKPGDVFLGLVHRLDRPVGGVVVFGRTSKGASRLSEQFRSRQVRKVYWAVVEGRPPEVSGQVRQWLKKDRQANRVRACRTEVSGSQLAELWYKVLRSDGGLTLVEIRPETGRPHQIRVAMSSLGCPILGDLKYGAKKGMEHEIALWAVSLEFQRPVGGDPVRVESRPDWDFIPGGRP